MGNSHPFFARESLGTKRLIHPLNGLTQKPPLLPPLEPPVIHQGGQRNRLLFLSRPRQIPATNPLFWLNTPWKGKIFCQGNPRKTLCPKGPFNNWTGPGNDPCIQGPPRVNPSNSSFPAGQPKESPERNLPGPKWLAP